MSEHVANRTVHLRQHVATKLSRIIPVECVDANEANHEGRSRAVTVCVAVSGGVDSMVLLNLTHLFCAKHQIDLIAVHVNHGMRSMSKRDEAFVRNHCQRMHIPLIVQQVQLADVPDELRAGAEADARRLRYKAVIATAKECDASMVLLGHHADDQVETVLWRLLRGTSATGLKGMRDEVEWDSTKFVRPLLDIPRIQIDNYAQVNQIEFVEDETNADVSFTRNRIRHQVVPILKDIQPDLTARIRVVTQLLADEDEYLESQAQQLVERTAVRHAFGMRVDLRIFQNRDRALQRRAIKIILYCLASSNWSFQHIESVMCIADSHRLNGEIKLAGGVMVRRIGHELTFFHNLDSNTSQAWSPFLWELRDGDIRVFDLDTYGGFRLECYWLPRPLDYRKISLNELWLPSLPSVEVDSNYQGHRILPLGMVGSKKLHDVYVDGKVPRWVRSQRPFLAVAGDIIWVPGLSRSRLLTLTDEPEYAWNIRFTAVNDESQFDRD